MPTATAPEQVAALICGDSMVAGSVREIAADDGSKWDHSIQFDVSEIQKSLKDVAPDAKPFFAEVLVLHRGHSRKSDGSKNVEYGEESVKDTARLLPGTIAYLGHPDPAKVEFEYRTPVGKYVAARVEEREVKDFGRVPCVIGKVYVSAAAPDLRTHLREGLAGPVSIYGAAMFRAVNGQRTNSTVGMSRLKSVDFCNAGTPGVAGAGVTGLVQEIAPAAPAPGAKKTMADAATRLSRREIEAEYPEIVAAIVREETASFEKTVKEMTTRAETAEASVKTLTGEKTALEGKVTEMTKAHGEAKTRADKAEGQVTEMQKAAKVTAVRDAALAKVAERVTAAKAGKDAKIEVPVLEMAAKRLPALIDASILPASDDDKNTLAVNAALAKFDAQVADVREMAKSFGAPGTRDVSEIAKGGTVASGGEDEGKRMATLFPSVAKRIAQKAKEAEGASK